MFQRCRIKANIPALGAGDRGSIPLFSKYKMQILGSVITIVLALSALIITLVFVISPKNAQGEKLSAYECGFEPLGDTRLPFDVRFYLVAILFILFDLETAFLFPWAVVIHHIGRLGFWAMMLFLAILLVGFIYEWKKGALEWE